MMASPYDEIVVLVAEDERPVREVMTRTFRQRGWTVLEAQDGEEAMRIAEEHAQPIDAIVADVKMPGMGGLELVQHFRRWYPGLRVLLVSGDPHIVRQPTPAQNNIALLAKPFSGAELVEAVLRLLE